MIGTLVLLFATTGCHHSAGVILSENCVPEYGYSCDWVAALEVTQAKACDDELRRHWSAAVRSACAGNLDGGIRFGANAVHAIARELPEQSGPPMPVPIAREHLREFSFPATMLHSALTSEREITAVAKTRAGVLVGIDQGEWGGALVWLPARGAPEILYRGSVVWIFEFGGRVYVVGRDSYWPRDPLFEVSRRGPERRATWEIELQFRLPGWLRSVHASDGELWLATDAGIVRLSDDGIGVVDGPLTRP